MEEAPFLSAEALLEGCASSGAAFATEVAPWAARGLLRPLCPSPSSFAKAPGPQLSRSLTWKCQPVSVEDLQEKKSKLFFRARRVRKLKVKPSKGSFKGRGWGGKRKRKYKIFRLWKKK